MFGDDRVVVVMPAYNAEPTLRRTYDEVMAQGVVDEIVLVDDASSDRTAEVARSLPKVTVFHHERNRGYGGNQKSCYRLALAAGADIVVMVHPDYQYTPLLIPAMTALIGSGLYDAVLGSRVLGGHALAGGMPVWRYVANRALTLFANLMTGAKLSEYHTGYRAFSGRLLRALPLDVNSDDFVFDHQMLSQILWAGSTIAEVSCPTRYATDSSSIDFRSSLVYGLGCVGTDVAFRLARWGLIRSRVFPPSLEGATSRPTEPSGDTPAP